jgi:hypothetical protein
MNVDQGSNTSGVSGEMQMDLSEAYQPYTADRETVAIRDENKRREKMIGDWHAETDREAYEQSRRSAGVVAWLVTVGLVGLFIALAALVGA